MFMLFAINASWPGQGATSARKSRPSKPYCTVIEDDADTRDIVRQAAVSPGHDELNHYGIH